MNMPESLNCMVFPASLTDVADFLRGSPYQPIIDILFDIECNWHIANGT